MLMARVELPDGHVEREYLAAGRRQTLSLTVFTPVSCGSDSYWLVSAL